MISRKQPHSLSSLSLLFLALLTISFIISSSNAADCTTGYISVYWGQHAEEGSLKDTCDSGNYDIVILQSLIVYDDSCAPTLNLENHCGTPENPCSNLEPEIKHCQDIGIKVFLSIGLDIVAGTTEDEDHTSCLVNYIYDNFLSGGPGPLGAVSLDGIDIQDVPDSQHIHWDELVTLLNESTTDRRIHISTSPQCVYPDRWLDAAIRTGLVDYIWVEFFYYNPSCIYLNGNPNNLLDAWHTWTSNVPQSLIFLGLTAYEDIAGYIEPEKLKTEILPIAKTASNYGGVMIWDRNSDKKNNYSGEIRDSVRKTCSYVRDKPTLRGFNSMLAWS